MALEQRRVQAFRPGRGRGSTMNQTGDHDERAAARAGFRKPSHIVDENTMRPAHCGRRAGSPRRPPPSMMTSFCRSWIDQRRKRLGIGAGSHCGVSCGGRRRDRRGTRGLPWRSVMLVARTGLVVTVVKGMASRS